MIDLYYAPDNASLIIRIILEELDIDYRAILVDRRKKQQTDSAYLALNPKGLIPVCIIDGEAVFETAAIALTLTERAEHYGAKSTIVLAPGIESSRRSQFLKWLFFLSNTLHPDLRQLFYAEKYVGSNEPLQESFRGIARQRLRHNLSILNKQYAAQSRCYLFGDSPSIVDIYLAVCVRWVQLYPLSTRGVVQVSDFASIDAMVMRLQQRKAVISACAKEGISGVFFSKPEDADPIEGSAF